MAILKNGMSIRCRTQEERDIFFEVSQKEGWTWNGTQTMEPLQYNYLPISFELGLRRKGKVTWGDVDRNYNGFQNIEASQLFHNHLISRRLKHGRNSTE